jgi:prephenate dehydratase
VSSTGAPLRVAFQGELGAFSEEAARRFFSEPIEPVPCREFREVGAAVAGGSVDYGLLPIENSLAGSVVASYDVLAAEPLEVVGEVIVPIRHCLLGLPGAEIGRITRVLSHPVALAQCSRFLTEHPAIEAVAVYDTAGAARDVARAGDPTVAAIAGRSAAERYGLEILASNIEDRPDNQTRFLVVARAGSAPPPDAVRAGNQKKTALLVEADNTPGSLVQVLLPFANRGINLSKLESRPAAEPWTYRFFMELEADVAAPDTQEALAEVRRRASSLRILGSFVRWTR